MSEPERPVRRLFLQRALTAGAALALPHGGPLATGVAQGSAAGSRLAEGAPSSTAQGAAVWRALHQVIDYPRILDDPLAVPIIGSEGARGLQAAADRQAHGLRAFIALRSRYAEDRLAAAVARGVRQYVVLGAGLDTFAYRNPHAARGLKVFEVDHPATQRWKRARLAEVGIALPPSLIFAPVDFETQNLSGELRRAGLDFGQPAFFSLLGVVIYLTEAAAMQSLGIVSRCAPGTEIVFEFSLPASRLSGTARASRERSMAQVAAIGEPWLTFFEPEPLAGQLRSLGFTGVDLLDPEEANRTYFAGRIDGLRMGARAYMTAARVSNLVCT
jgi:methyltransferase (TIGR00027 family)